MFCLFLIEGVPKFGSIDMMRFCWLGKVCSWWSWRFVSCPHPWNPRPLEESTHVKYCIELACNEERWHVYRRWGDGGCVRCRRCFPKLDDAFFGLAQSLWTGCINANHVRLGWFGWSNNIKSLLCPSNYLLKSKFHDSAGFLLHPNQKSWWMWGMQPQI